MTEICFIVQLSKQINQSYKMGFEVILSLFLMLTIFCPHYPLQLPPTELGMLLQISPFFKIETNILKGN